MNPIKNRMELSLCLLGLALLAAACHAAQVPTEPAKPTLESAKLDQPTTPNSQKDEDDDVWFKWPRGKQDYDPTKLDQPTTPNAQKDEDDDVWFKWPRGKQDYDEEGDSDAGRDYDEDDFYGDDDECEDEEVTLEDELIDLAMQHQFVKRDCLDAQEMINMAKNASQAVDPELQQGFKECQSDLEEINSEMRALIDQITQMPLQ